MSEGEKIFNRITNNDFELFNLIMLLPTIFTNQKDVYKLLERMDNENLTLKAFYPEFNKKEQKGEFVGSIYDGFVWLVNK